MLKKIKTYTINNKILFEFFIFKLFIITLLIYYIYKHLNPANAIFHFDFYILITIYLVFILIKLILGSNDKIEVHLLLLSSFMALIITLAVGMVLYLAFLLFTYDEFIINNKMYRKLTIFISLTLFTGLAFELLDFHAVDNLTISMFILSFFTPVIFLTWWLNIDILDYLEGATILYMLPEAIIVWVQELKRKLFSSI